MRKKYLRPRRLIQVDVVEGTEGPYIRAIYFRENRKPTLVKVTMNQKKIIRTGFAFAVDMALMRIEYQLGRDFR